VKLVVGLGNPGIEYAFTPHNVGFLAIDRIAQQKKVRVANRHCRALTGRTEIAGHQVLLAKPETFMNLSGLAVRELVEEYEIAPEQDLIVLYDELALPLGMIRVRPLGSSAGHNGAQSIIGTLGTEEFTRVRMGVNLDPEQRHGADYLLSQIKKSQYEVFDRMLDDCAQAVELILSEGVQATMNRFNRRASGEAAEAE
jgi:PTH1 family peptidyl-tRNA hydrolase